MTKYSFLIITNKSGCFDRTFEGFVNVYLGRSNSPLKKVVSSRLFLRSSRILNTVRCSKATLP